MKSPLPEPLPSSPLALIAEWIAEAEQAFRVAPAMTLATVDPDGRPSARMVICRGFDASEGSFVFYSDGGSAKGQALEGRYYHRNVDRARQRSHRYDDGGDEIETHERSVLLESETVGLRARPAEQIAIA